MRPGKWIGDRAGRDPGYGNTVSSVVTPPLSARPHRLEASRAGLLECLARDPRISRSVGLVR